jgi:signal transduction histidine kinase
MLLFKLIIAAVIACLASASLANESGRPRSLLVLDDANVRSPFYYEVFSRLRATANASTGPPVTIYAESLDLTRFSGQAYEDGLQQFLRAKYGDKPIGVIIAIGSAALDRVLRWRSTLWLGVPIVFGFVDEPTVARLSLPPDVTGDIVQLRFADMMTAARAVVPDLKGIAFVGDPLERQTVYRHWKDEIPSATMDLQIVDLTGLKMRELRQRVASLPDHTAILYTGVYSDGEGTFYVPAEALALISMTANRPIVGTAETDLGRGSIGGFLIAASLIGESAAGLAMRILDGEDPANIPVTLGSAVKPIFDWRQMQRWGVGESSLPPGSEIRYYEPTGWDRYKPQIVAISAAILVQAAFIIWLVSEHRYRQRAEAIARDTVSELTQVNRLAAAGELSASIAHEINQPLTGIVTRASAARRWLARENPEIDKARAALGQIELAGIHASEIIQNIRAIFKRDAHDRVPVDINRIILAVVALGGHEIQKHQIEIRTQLDDRLPMVCGNEIQLQQVILNLLTNAVEAMHFGQPRVLRLQSRLTKPEVVNISIEDTGVGIGPSGGDRIFKPLFTTKARGMGMGLSICRSIIEGHHGRIWASQNGVRGSIFQFELPAELGNDEVAARVCEDDRSPRWQSDRFCGG